MAYVLHMHIADVLCISRCESVSIGYTYADHMQDMITRKAKAVQSLIIVVRLSGISIYLLI